MEEEKIRRKIGKKCLITTKDLYKYTAIIPDFTGKSISIYDKFNNDISIDIDFIVSIQEL